MTTKPSALDDEPTMRPFSTLMTLAGVAVLAAGIACGTTVTAPNPDAPETRPSDGLKLLTVAPDSPPLATTRASFYAVKGRGAGVDLYYRARPGRTDSARFVQFRMGGASLDRRPDGSLIAQGDSVLITLTVVDPLHLLIDFQPSGLVFSPGDRPKLQMFFGSVGDDLDHNGIVDAEDDKVRNSLSIWRQEAVNQPWFKLATARLTEEREVEAELLGFTGYAMAY